MFFSYQNISKYLQNDCQEQNKLCQIIHQHYAQSNATFVIKLLDNELHLFI